MADSHSVRTQVIVPAPIGDVWNAWTDARSAETFFAEKVRIDLRIGGRYEIYFNPADERMSTKGRRVLSYEPQRMLSFEWNLPLDQFPEQADHLSWVVVNFGAVGHAYTRVGVTQLGLPENCTDAVPHMRQGWRELGERLRRRFIEGPIDWQREAMMWQQRAHATDAGVR